MKELSDNPSLARLLASPELELGLDSALREGPSRLDMISVHAQFVPRLVGYPLIIDSVAAIIRASQEKISPDHTLALVALLFRIGVKVRLYAITASI